MKLSAAAMKGINLEKTKQRLTELLSNLFPERYVFIVKGQRLDPICEKCFSYGAFTEKVFHSDKAAQKYLVSIGAKEINLVFYQNQRYVYWIDARILY